MIKTNLKLILRNWLIHFFVIWATINLFNVISFIYNTRVAGMILQHQDGTLVTWQERFVDHNFHQPEMLIIGLGLLIIEFIYHIFFSKKKFIAVGISCMLTSVVAFLALLIMKHRLMTVKELLPGTPAVFIMVGYCLIYCLLRDYFHNYRYKKEIQIQKSKNELDALKAQLNPHFLFNSLNYLYGTALNEQAPNTADGIDKLSAMMRYTITGVHENFVPVDAELAFIRNYLDLQLERLPKKDNIKASVNINAGPSALEIAPLLTLPFIENAFQYGISMDETCFVSIAIDLENDLFQMSISNSIVSNQSRTAGNNTGIKNTVKRLELLYPEKYKIQQSHTETEYHTKLILKLNR